MWKNLKFVHWECDWNFTDLLKYDVDEPILKKPEKLKHPKEKNKDEKRGRSNKKIPDNRNFKWRSY